MKKILIVASILLVIAFATIELRSPRKQNRAAATLAPIADPRPPTYNWGEGRVARVIHRTGIRDFWTMAERGLLPEETAKYVPSVLAASQLLFGNNKTATEAKAASGFRGAEAELKGQTGSRQTRVGDY